MGSRWTLTESVSIPRRFCDPQNIVLANIHVFYPTFCNFVLIGNKNVRLQIDNEKLVASVKSFVLFDLCNVQACDNETTIASTHMIV